MISLPPFQMMAGLGILHGPKALTRHFWAEHPAARSCPQRRFFWHACKCALAGALVRITGPGKAGRAP